MSRWFVEGKKLCKCVRMAGQEKNENVPLILCKSVHWTCILLHTNHHSFLLRKQIPAMVGFNTYYLCPIYYASCLSMPCYKLSKRMQIGIGTHTTYQLFSLSTNFSVRPACFVQDSISKLDTFLTKQVSKFSICIGSSDLFSVHSAHPCDKDGYFLPLGSHSQPQQLLDAIPQNPFHPFEDRLAFKFTDFHFSEQQSSVAAID